METASPSRSNRARQTIVNSLPYTWDANGNLLNDGVHTYTYDPANRLTAVSGQQTAISFGYNGLGDRLRQTFNGQTTDYSLDINTDLTTVLADNSNNYIYGHGNVAQVGPENTSYFLGDVLGSTRQLSGDTGDINLSQTYDPFGNSIGSTGTDVSIHPEPMEAVLMIALIALPPELGPELLYTACKEIENS